MTNVEVGKVKEGVFHKEPSRCSKGGCSVLNRSCEKKVIIGKGVPSHRARDN